MNPVEVRLTLGGFFLVFLLFLKRLRDCLVLELREFNIGSTYRLLILESPEAVPLTAVP